MPEMFVSGGSLNGKTIEVPEVGSSVNVPIWNKDLDQADLESYRIKTNPGPQAEDGTYPDYFYSLEFVEVLTYVRPNFYTSKAPKRRRTFRMRVAHIGRLMAEKISPRYLDPIEPDDYDDYDEER